MSMSKKITTIVFCALAAFCVCACNSDAQYEINIFHTSNMLATLYPDQDNPDALGIERIAIERMMTKNSLLVDCGNTLFGNPDLPAADVLTLLSAADYDIMTPAFGDFAQATAPFESAQSDLKIVASNLDSFLTTFVMGTGGLSIGFFGISSIQDNDMNQYVDAALAAVDALEQRQPDIIIGLCALERSQTKQIAASLEGRISLLIDADQGQVTAETVDGIYIASASGSTVLGRIRLEFNKLRKLTNIDSVVLTKQDLQFELASVVDQYRF